MVQVLAERLTWDKWNLEHIKLHRVTATEVETMLRDENRKTARSYNDRLLITRRAGERMISAVFAYERNNKFYPITARDASKKERNYYREK